jgi:ubiquitin C-terminal hydrolase
MTLILFQDLDLLASAKLNPDHEYRLTGVVNHLGDLANMGHYVADIFAKGRWRRYNDTHIRPIATEEMLNRSSVDGYLFFYTHDAYCTGSRRMEDGKDDKENL